jgi:hypothetical protein
MSWDVWLEMDTGGPIKTEVSESFNYTHNCNCMLRDVGIEWSEMRNMKGKDVVFMLDIAIEKLKSDPEKYRKMNPSNGWGSYDSLLSVLERIVEDFSMHPKATLGVCV